MQTYQERLLSDIPAHFFTVFGQTFLTLMINFAVKVGLEISKFQRLKDSKLHSS